MKVENDIYFALVGEQLSEGQRVRIELRGTSMMPTLREGDVLTLAPLTEAPVVGDVLLFRHCGTHLLHRVVARSGENLTLQGDNCYSTESCVVDDVVGRLVYVDRLGDVGGAAWRQASRRGLRWKRWRNMAIRCFGRNGRRRLRPWYFAALAILMWAPLNGLGVPLDNYILGLRADHLLHASVYLPCTLFLIDLVKRRWWALLAAIGIGLLTEWVQYLLPYRGFDVNDMVANVIGTTLGWVAILLVRRAIRKRHRYPVRVRRGGCR